MKLKKRTKLLGEKAIKDNKMARQFLAPQRARGTLISASTEGQEKSWPFGVVILDGPNSRVYGDYNSRSRTV